MISDTFSETIQEIDKYLYDPVFRDVYTGKCREKIIAVRDAMKKIQIQLDTGVDDND